MVFALLINTSAITLLVLVSNDSPVTFGLFIDTNHWKFEGIFAFKIAFTGEPLQISRLVGIERTTSGWTWAINEESGPIHPSGNEVGVWYRLQIVVNLIN